MLLGHNFWDVPAGWVLSCLPVSLPEADVCCGCAALLAAACMPAAGGDKGPCCRAAASDWPTDADTDAFATAGDVAADGMGSEARAAPGAAVDP